MRHLFGSVLTALLVIPLLAFAQAGQFAFPDATPEAGTWGLKSMCSVTASAPTYVPGQIAPLSCDASGNLRANLGGSVTIAGNISATTALTLSLYLAQLKTTTSAVQLANQPGLNGFTIKADSANAGIDCFGGSGVTSTHDGTGAGWCLRPGEAVYFGVQNLNQLYVIGSVANDVDYVSGP